MSGLINAIMLGAGFSFLSAGLTYIVARFLQSRTRGAETLIWRTARLIAILPLLLAPVVYSIPQVEQVGAGTDWAMEEPFAAIPFEPPEMILPTVQQSSSTLTSEQVLVWVYFSGLILFLLAGVRRHFMRRRMINSSRHATKSERSTLDDLAEKVGVSGLELRIINQGISPCITGWRAVMIMPEALLSDRKTSRYAMLHELTHIKRGDEKDRLFATALLTLLWFNWPLKWIEHELNAARELACDRDVIKLLGGSERKPYAETLIHLMRDMSLPVSAFGPDNRRQREMRIKSILSTPAKRPAHKIMLALLLTSSLVPMACAQVATTERRMASAPVEMIEVQTQKVEAPLNQAAIFVSADSLTNRGSESFVSGEIQVTIPENVVFSSHIVEGRLSSGYGPRSARPADSPLFHGGVDIAAPTGTPVQSAAVGVVSHSQEGFNGSDRWGNTIVVDHGQGWQTIYAHLDTLDVEEGQVLTAGHQIGTVGETGAATGPHVHVEVRFNGERVDPAAHIPGLN